jgi:hypothetical protein
MRSVIQETVDRVGQVVLGKERQIKLVVACLLSEGHLLIEDIPGMGKPPWLMRLERYSTFLTTASSSRATFRRPILSVRRCSVRRMASLCFTRDQSLTS